MQRHPNFFSIFGIFKHPKPIFTIKNVMIVLVEQGKKFKNPKIIVLTGKYANDVIVLIYL